MAPILNCSTFASILFSPGSLHNGVSAMLLGGQIWNSFIAGPVMFRTLPRPQFGLVQSKMFPHYFRMQSILSLFLLGSWIYHRPETITLDKIFDLCDGDVLNLWGLGSVAIASLANYLYVGPWTSSIMKERTKLSKDLEEQGKDPQESTEIQNLNKSFGKAHGISSVLNLVSVLGIVFHQLWLGTYPLGFNLIPQIPQFNNNNDDNKIGRINSVKFF